MTTARDEAQMWLERGRPDKAEEHLRHAITLDPDDGDLRILLGMTLLNLDKNAEALEVARSGVSARPDKALAHVVLARALSVAGKKKEALESAEQAVKLNPSDPDNWAAVAHCQLANNKWSLAIQAAEYGLELDPSDETCLNIRAFASTQLGDRSGARDDLTAALHHDPDNPVTHFNLGWNALHSARGKDARSHFREALRLRPGWEPARSGLIEAIKASNPIFRPIFWLLLQITRVPPKVAFLILIGTVFLRVWLARLAESYPDFAPVFWGAFWVIAGLVLFSLIVNPLLNLTLLLHADGRYALRPLEKLQGAVIGVFLLLAVTGILLSGPYERAGFAAVMLMIGWSSALGVSAAKPRLVFAAAMSVLTLIGIYMAWQDHTAFEFMASIDPDAPIPGAHPGMSQEEVSKLALQVPELAAWSQRIQHVSSLFDTILFGSIAVNWIAGMAGGRAQGES